MLVGFDTNILVYTLQTPGNPNLDQARDLVNRAAGSGSVGLLLQSLTEFSHVAIRKLRMDVVMVRRRVAAFIFLFRVARRWNVLASELIEPSPPAALRHAGVQRRIPPRASPRVLR